MALAFRQEFPSCSLFARKRLPAGVRPQRGGGRERCRANMARIRQSRPDSGLRGVGFGGHSPAGGGGERRSMRSNVPGVYRPTTYIPLGYSVYRPTTYIPLGYSVYRPTTYIPLGYSVYWPTTYIHPQPGTRTCRGRRGGAEEEREGVLEQRGEH